jgi:hypothetical protein
MAKLLNPFRWLDSSPEVIRLVMTMWFEAMSALLASWLWVQAGSRLSRHWAR